MLVLIPNPGQAERKQPWEPLQSWSARHMAASFLLRERWAGRPGLCLLHHSGLEWHTVQLLCSQRTWVSGVLLAHALREVTQKPVPRPTALQVGTWGVSWVELRFPSPGRCWGLTVCSESDTSPQVPNVMGRCSPMQQHQEAVWVRQ